MSELRKYNTDALFIFPLIADGSQDFVTDYTPAAGDAKVFTDKLISTNPTALILGFDSLSELPNAGDQLDENGAGTAEGVVAFTVIISGTVGGGDAAGFFFMRSVTGEAWTNNDQIDINGGTANIATADSTTYDLAATAGLIGEIGNGMFAAALSPTEMTCAQGEIHIVDSATKAIEDQALRFETYGNASALHGFDLDDATGAGLSAIPWNAAWDAEVQSEVADALVAIGLDHLVSASVAGSDVTDNSIFAKLVSKESTADWDDFDNLLHSLQAQASSLKEIDTGTSPTASGLTLKSGSLAEPGDLVHILSSGNSVRGTRIINSIASDVAVFSAVWDTTPTTPITYALFASPLAETVTVGSMDTDVVDSVALASSAADEIRDAIVDDATRFAGADIAAILASFSAPRKNVALADLSVFMVASSDHVTPKTGLTLSVTRSLDAGAFGAGTGTAAEIASGMYQYDASQADMNAAVIIFRFTGTDADDTFITIHTRA